jgi:hypothetical protein
VILSWARDREGARVQVGDLDPRRRGDRAPFTCPGCADVLVPHLGRVRARHFAHRPGSTCPLTSPETALHQNAKERLAWLCEEAFAGRRRVVLRTRCPRCRRPAAVDVASSGDAAVLEGQVGSRRADVLVTRDDRPALAIEVRVAHAVEAEKEAALAAIGVPVAEVDAAASWEAEEAGTTSVTCGRSLGFPPCPSCASQALSEAGRVIGGEEAELAELEAYRARGLLGPPPGRPVSGEVKLTYRDQELIEKKFRCPTCALPTLTFGDRVARHACPGSAPRAVAWRGYDGALVEMQWWRGTPRRVRYSPS